MSIDFISALKAPYRKDCGIARLFLGGLCIFIPILAFVPMGYIAEYLNKQINGKDELGNIFQHGSKSFSIGVKMFLGSILLHIPYLLVIAIISLLLSEKHPFVYSGLSSLLSLVWGFVCLIMSISFSVDFKILSMVDFVCAYKIIKEAPLKALVVGLLSYAISMLYVLVFLVPYIVVIIIFAVSMVISNYLLAIIGGILLISVIVIVFFASIVSIYSTVGQFAKESQYIQSIKQELV